MAVRRLVLAGLILLGAWLVLVGIRAAIPSSIIEALAEETGRSVEAMSELVNESDWSNSLLTDEPVAEMIGGRLGGTVQLLVFGGLLSLALAAVLLSLGVLVARVTDRPPWLARVRSILRLVLVSGGVSNPVFISSSLFIVSATLWWDWKPPFSLWWQVFFVALLPAWLLVQAGHGELASWPGKLSGSYGLLARHLSVRLVIRLLKLVGAVIVVVILIGGGGLGRLMFDAVFQSDFPVSFGVAWVFVLIVVLVKLVAELIEIAHNHFGHLPVSSENRQEPAASRLRIPRGWLIFCLVLVFISIMVAAVGPVLAPYGYNEFSLADRLMPPSAEHILGTDNLGRDMLSRLLYGTRTTLLAGLLSVGILSVVAVGWAMLVAYLRKANNWRGDTLADLVMLPRDLICAFPWLVLLLLLMTMVGSGFWQVVLVGSLVLLPRAVSMLQEAYYAPPEGRGWLYSVLWSVPVMILLAVAGGVLYTSAISYLGWGIPPPVPELGSILSAPGRKYLLQAPWLAQWPALCLVLLSLVWVMAGEAWLERLGWRGQDSAPRQSGLR